MQAQPPGDLPPPLDALWGRRGAAERGRRPGLTVDRVVQAAVELADADGLAAVTMSRVAERLGFTTMALYRHVRGKDELIALMVDAAVEPPIRPDDPAPEGWRAGLERWSWDLLEVVRLHPWLLGISLPNVPFGPSRLAWLERGLRALAHAGLDEDEKAALILLVNNYVFSEARLAAEVGNSGPGSDQAHSLAGEDAAALGELIDAERFPAVHRALAAGIFDPTRVDRDAEFAFGLERILDGVERLVAERR